jgi:hypothetical protein
MANSIVPWASEWLFFYEMWLITGEWDGGGRWPPLPSPEPQAHTGHGVRWRPQVEQKRRSCPPSASHTAHHAQLPLVYR